MGRRRAGAASPADTSAPADPPVGRRSSRLAVKDRVDYNEDRTFKKILAEAPKAAPKKPKKSAEPRKTARSKDKLSKGGSVAVRITNESSTYPASTTTRTTRATATSSGNATSFRSDPPSFSDAFSTVTVASSPVQQSIGVSSTTPDASRKHAARKQPVRACRVATALATVDEDVPLTMPSSPRSVGLLKRARAPATITPDTSLMMVDQEALKQRPTKKTSRKERSQSPPDHPIGRSVQPRGTTLFKEELEEELAAAAARAADDTLRVAMNDQLLVDNWVVPEKKKRKESTVATKDRITVPQQADSKKKNRVSAAQVPSKSGRAGSVSFFMTRTVKTEDVVERNRLDDAFANRRINEGPGELDRSISIAAGIESGTLALEDMQPEDRWLRELFSPISRAGTPRVDRSLATGSPLIISASSPDVSGNNKRKQRAAGTRARKNLSLLFESESDADSTIRSPSERREMTSSFVTEPTFDPIRAQKYLRNKDVRALFKAATGNASKQATARVASSSMDGTTATRNAMHTSIQRKKIQYPGIAPLPEDIVENTVADTGIPALMDLLL